MLRLLSMIPELYPANPRFDLIIDSCELDRGGVSYTYDTVRYILTRIRRGRVAVVKGDDLLEGMPSGIGSTN
jgi:nicotinate-nucleotide adenylyltransferase